MPVVEVESRAIRRAPCGSARYGPNLEVYVEVRFGDGEAVPDIISRSFGNQRVFLVPIGAGYKGHNGPRSMLRSALTDAESVAAAFRRGDWRELLNV